MSEQHGIIISDIQTIYRDCTCTLATFQFRAVNYYREINEFREIVIGGSRGEFKFIYYKKAYYNKMPNGTYEKIGNYNVILPKWFAEQWENEAAEIFANPNHHNLDNLGDGCSEHVWCTDPQCTFFAQLFDIPSENFFVFVKND